MQLWLVFTFHMAIRLVFSAPIKCVFPSLLTGGKWPISMKLSMNLITSGGLEVNNTFMLLALYSSLVTVCTAFVTS